MYDLAKKGREAMKSKARRLASEKVGKVDSSDWSPAEPLNGDIKTGLRPISRRTYKTGGKVMGEECAPRADRKPRKAGGKAESEKAEAAEYAKAKINRNVKAANEQRPGIKHVGALKTGGRAKREYGGPPPRLSDPVGSMIGSGTVTTPPARRPPEPSPQSKPHKAPVVKPKASDKPVDMSTMTADEAAEFMRSRKAGGRTKKMGGGYVSHGTARGKPVIPGMKKGGRTKKMGGGALLGGILPAIAMGGMGKKDDGEGKKAGGRIARKSGGRAKGKTSINIVINAKPTGDDASAMALGPDAMRAPAGMRPPGGVPVPMPAPAVGGMPMPMPVPMPAGGPPGGLPGGPAPLMRRRGGKVYRSYKDMDAGAGSGLGRLEKTEIQSRK